MKLLTLIGFLFFSELSNAQFSSEDSATINLVGGNTDLKTYVLKSENTFKKTVNSLTVKGIYNYGESENIRSVENWNLGLQYERELTDKMSLYLGEFVESDRFSGYRRRYNSDIGLKYFFSVKDSKKIFSEVGYRYTVEKNRNESIADKNDSKGRVYLEGKIKHRSDLSSKFWIEYLPNFSNSSDYLVSFEPSLIVTLNSIFSLKTGYLWKYDNQPVPGNGKHDYSFNLTLIAKF